VSDAREAALIVLYEAAMAGLDEPDTTELTAKAKRIVDGVTANTGEIDAALAKASHNWALTRMPPVDRSVLRVAAFELAHTDTPVGVIISEAVALAKRYSTERSASFVNGVLAALAEASGR
jgi:N utilization substance protein B